MARGDLVIAGVCVMGLGLAVTAITYSAASESGGTYLIASGPIIFGLSLIVRGLAASDSRPQGPLPEPDQMRGRYGPSSEGPQLAGSKCVHCGAKILSTMEATTCRRCNKPVHLDCRKDHRAEAHPKEAGAPAR